MPFYQCLTTPGTLDADQRRTFAEQITKHHTEVTGAPADFVHVAFRETGPDELFTAGRPSTTTVIQGLQRAGRPDHMRTEMINRLAGSYYELTGKDPMEVLILVNDIPASWAMEGGMILPEPTPDAEAAWFDTLRERGHQPTA